MMKLHKSAVSAHLLSPRCSSATRSVARATPAPAPVDTVPIRIGTRGSPLAQHQAQQVLPAVFLRQQARSAAAPGLRGPPQGGH